MPVRYSLLLLMLPVFTMMFDHSNCTPLNTTDGGLLSTNFSYLGEIQLDVEAGDVDTLTHLVSENSGFVQAFLGFYQGFIQSIFGDPKPPPPPQDQRLLHII